MRNRQPEQMKLAAAPAPFQHHRAGPVTARPAPTGQLKLPGNMPTTGLDVWRVGHAVPYRAPSRWRGLPVSPYDVARHVAGGPGLAAKITIHVRPGSVGACRAAGQSGTLSLWPFRPRRLR